MPINRGKNQLINFKSIPTENDGFVMSVGLLSSNLLWMIPSFASQFYLIGWQ